MLYREKVYLSNLSGHSFTSTENENLVANFPPLVACSIDRAHNDTSELVPDRENTIHFKIHPSTHKILYVDK